MTSPTLKVTPEGLRTVAQRCEALAGTVAAALPPVSASGWQSTGAATSAVNAVMSTTGTVYKSRMTANANKLTKAAADYEHQDGQGAERLTAVGSHLPAGAGGDGGAAGKLPPHTTPLVPRGSGVDGGSAGGFGMGR